MGDLVRVRRARIPVDGEVVAESPRSTSRCSPVNPSRSAKRQTTRVAGAAIDIDGLRYVRATAVGEDTALAQIVRLVEEGQGSKAPIQRLAVLGCWTRSSPGPRWPSPWVSVVINSLRLCRFGRRPS